MTTHTSARGATAVTLVTAPGCHFCDEARAQLSTLVQSGAPVELSVIEAASAEGRALLAAHRPAMNPLVLVDGEYFSAGRLPRRKLDALLRRRATGTEATEHG